ncbi:MAG: microcompartment protein [Rhodobacteraceae bacterium]|nr:microcompartment protein [Paracoccaceae bacterium]
MARFARAAAVPPPGRRAGELRVYLTIEDLQPQFAAALATPTRARGYPPLAGQHTLAIEVAPGLMIERVIDLALKQDPELEPGILFVERQFGVLELHGPDPARLARAGRAILAGLGLGAEQQLRPRVLFADIIENLSDQHAILINRSRQASMALPGQTLLLCEIAPALFAAVAANEAERAAPDLTMVDVQMIGAAGRIYMAGAPADATRALARIEEVLAAIEGREA